ncbi:hypothetical protein CPC08DRAFT_785097 [Agrocybe pediades]|nr:hypothetical protein CPC08DRAFT_785097 [Agrocybe pediades]
MKRTWTSGPFNALKSMTPWTGWVLHAAALRLLLQLPSVWGRLLHVPSFEHAADAWREVITKRIGNAPLWITGDIESNSTRLFIMPILEEKWHNVQVLDVTDEHLYRDMILPTWSFLEREAPMLEIFKLWTYRGIFDETETRILPFSPLFNDHAPRLKVFSADNSLLTLPAPWLSNLDYIKFSDMQSMLSILSALTSMPLLRHLYISGNKARQSMVDSNVVISKLNKPHLPLLEVLWIGTGDPLALCLLLESITLSPGPHALRTLRIPRVDKTPLDTSQQRVNRAITKWIHSYMNGFPPNYLRLRDCNRVLTLSDTHSPCLHDGMEVELVSDGHSHLIIENIADSPQISLVKELDVSLYEVTEAIRWPLQPLYQVLRSITHLAAEGYGIGALFHDMLQFSLFPNLRTITLSGLNTFTDNHTRTGNASVIPEIINFLEHRASIGSHLSLLDLSSVNPPGVSDRNRERLEKIRGLSVKFWEQD